MIYNSLFQEFDDLIINTKSVHAELPIKNNIFSDSCAKMYDLFTEEKFQINPKIPKGFYDFVNIIYKFHNTETAQNIGEPIQYELCEKKSVKENKKVLVGFSGGCDSCYLALNLRQKGYDVTLFHVDKLNPYAQPNEDNYSRKFAESCNFKYIEIKYKRNKHEAYRENPMKNQLIMGFMIDYCLENNISNIGLGSDYTQDLFKDSVVGLDATDSAQINQYFWKGVENYVEGLNLIFIEDSIKKVDRIKYILDYDAENNTDLFSLVYSCTMPYRYFNQLRTKNIKKYNIQLLEHSCGSCVKCCMEFLYLKHLGFYKDTDENNEFENHCWEILTKSKNAFNPERYRLNIPISERWKTLLNEGS